MDENKLEHGDLEVMAKALNCPKMTVRFVVEGRRGKRGTDLQRKILAAKEYRERQNIKFREYCRNLQVQEVVPA